MTTFYDALANFYQALQPFKTGHATGTSLIVKTVEDLITNAHLAVGNDFENKINRVRLELLQLLDSDKLLSSNLRFDIDLNEVQVAAEQQWGLLQGQSYSDYLDDHFEKLGYYPSLELENIQPTVLTEEQKLNIDQNLKVEIRTLYNQMLHIPEVAGNVHDLNTKNKVRWSNEEIGHIFGFFRRKNYILSKKELNNTQLATLLGSMTGNHPQRIRQFIGESEYPMNFLENLEESFKLLVSEVREERKQKRKKSSL